MRTEARTIRDWMVMMMTSSSSLVSPPIRPCVPFVYPHFLFWLEKENAERESTHITDSKHISSIPANGRTVQAWEFHCIARAYPVCWWTERAYEARQTQSIHDVDTIVNGSTIVRVNQNTFEFEICLLSIVLGFIFPFFLSVIIVACNICLTACESYKSGFCWALMKFNGIQCREEYHLFSFSRCHISTIKNYLSSLLKWINSALDFVV